MTEFFSADTDDLDAFATRAIDDDRQLAAIEETLSQQRALLSGLALPYFVEHSEIHRLGELRASMAENGRRVAAISSALKLRGSDGAPAVRVRVGRTRTPPPVPTGSQPGTEPSIARDHQSPGGLSVLRSLSEFTALAEQFAATSHGSGYVAMPGRHRTYLDQLGLWRFSNSSSALLASMDDDARTDWALVGAVWDELEDHVSVNVGGCVFVCLGAATQDGTVALDWGVGLRYDLGASVTWEDAIPDAERSTGIERRHELAASAGPFIGTWSGDRQVGELGKLNDLDGGPTYGMKFGGGWSANWKKRYDTGSAIKSIFSSFTNSD